MKSANLAGSSYLVAALLLLLGVSLVFPVYASDVTPQSSFDVACGDVVELIDAINQANDEVAHPGPDIINLDEGCLYNLTNIDNNYGGRLNGLPLVTTDITINGYGATIQRDQLAPRFRIWYLLPSSKLVLNDLIIRNSGELNNGGAIYSWGGELSINNSTFENNSTIGAGGAIWINGNGAKLTILHSTFSNNAAIEIFGALGWGGAINAGGENPVDLSISDSAFYGNSSNRGGAVFHCDGILTVTNSIFSSNIGSAAALSSCGTANISSTTFIANDGFGGPIVENYSRLDTHSGQMTILDSTISNNLGSAITNRVSSSLNMSGSQITGNVASTGGALTNEAGDGGAVHLNYSCIVGNSDTGVLNYTGDILDLTNNWWGSVDGPSGVASGSGDSVSANVSYAPFLTSEPAECATLQTQTPTSTPTQTETPTETPTHTPTYTFTNTPTYSPTNTSTSTPTNTPTHSPTSTLTPAQATKNLIQAVRNLVSAGTLTSRQGNALIVKLNAAVRNLQHGNLNAASNQLEAFINRVNRLIRSRTLTIADGQRLIDAANAILDQIGG